MILPRKRSHPQSEFAFFANLIQTIDFPCDVSSSWSSRRISLAIKKALQRWIPQRYTNSSARSSARLITNISTICVSCGHLKLVSKTEYILELNRFFVALRLLSAVFVDFLVPRWAARNPVVASLFIFHVHS
jgi:hypothetical protein